MPEPGLERIKLGEKLSYFMTIVGSPSFITVVTLALMFFYTDVVGLNPAAVATLFLISRVMDALNDPIVGYFLDRVPRKRFGKFRFLLIVGTIVCSLNYLLLWFGPAMAPAGKTVIAYITYLLFGITFDIMDVSRNSILPVITADKTQRTTLSIFHTVAILIGSVGVSAVAPLVIDAGGQNLGSYQILIIGVTAFVLFFTVIGTLGVKERVMPAEEKSGINFKGFVSIFKQRPIFFMLLFMVFYGFGSNIANGLNMYFYTYIIHDITVMSTVALISVVGLIPGVAISRAVILRIGIKNVIMLAALVTSVCLAMRMIAPTSITLIYISTVISGFAMGVFAPVSPILSAENIDYIEYKLHMRSEASMGAISTFVTKLGGGIGGALPGYMLALTGYIPDVDTQPAAVYSGIIIMSLLVPAVCYLLGLIIFKFGYNVDFKEVSAALAERRAQGNKTDFS